MSTSGPPRVVAAIVRAPFTSRSRRELLFCLIGMLTGLGFAVVSIGTAAGTATAVGLAQDSAAWTAVGATIIVLFLAAMISAGRPFGAMYRRLASRLLGERVAAPPPLRAADGMPGRLAARFRDGPGWRAMAYLLLKVPFAVAGCYAIGYWGTGLADLTYPFWWGLFRNHPATVRLSPVPVLTPFGAFHVETFSGTFLALAAGAGILLAAPWVTRVVVSVDRRLIRGLLGPGTLAQRVSDLEQTRALAVDDSAAVLRRVERDLHDGAQIRLATLAMNLGMAKEKLGTDDEPLDVTAVRALVDAAHQGAKDALIELRDLAKGIHPPVLDNGLTDALATLAAVSAIPVELTTTIPRRFTPAIETIAYFCAAELLANAVKHSFANKIEIRAAERAGVLLVTVTDDGTGGADPASGSGLTGLAQRVRTVDGRLDIASPPGGPTQIRVELPARV